MFADFVKEQLVAQRLENVKQVQEEVNKAWVQSKLEKHIERWGGIFTKKELENKIVKDICFAALFAKDPLKQNLSEKLCGQYIGVDKLPASGKNCIRFNDEGDIVSTSRGNTKSADFEIEGVYYTQKYTGGNTGGAQDNQFNDVVDFLKRGSQQYKVGAIVDGEYWDEMGHRDKLKSLFEGNANVIICSADDLV